MRNIILHFIIFMIIGTANSQDLKGALKEMNLKGKVKSIRETSFKAVQKSGKVEKGARKMESPEYARDFYLLINNKGLITERTEYNSDGSIWRKSNYQYNEVGKIINEKIYNSKDTLIDENNTTYYFDEKRNVVAYDMFDKKNTLIQKFKCVYDSRGNVIEANYYNLDGGIVSKSNSEFDEKGNLIEQTIVQQDKSWKYIYKYDEKNNCIEETNYYPANKFVIKYLRKFDSYGNQTEIAWCKENGKIYRTYYEEYDYDVAGNWKMKTEYRQKHKPMYILERQIAYY